MTLTNQQSQELLAAYQEAFPTSSVEELAKRLWNLVVGTDEERKAALSAAVTQSLAARQSALTRFDAECVAAKTKVEESVARLQEIDTIVKTSAVKVA